MYKFVFSQTLPLLHLHTAFHFYKHLQMSIRPAFSNTRSAFLVTPKLSSTHLTLYPNTITSCWIYYTTLSQGQGNVFFKKQIKIMKHFIIHSDLFVFRIKHLIHSLNPPAIFRPSTFSLVRLTSRYVSIQENRIFRKASLMILTLQKTGKTPLFSLYLSFLDSKQPVSTCIDFWNKNYNSLRFSTMLCLLPAW